MRIIIVNKMLMRKLFLLTLFGLVFLLIYITFFKDSPINDADRAFRLKKIEEIIYSQASSQACKQPKLPVYSPEMMKFVFKVNPLNCDAGEPDWVKCNGSECFVQEQIKLLYGPIRCQFIDIIRVNDFQSMEGEHTYSDSYYKLEISDVVKVSCGSQVTLSKRWSATLTGIRQDREILQNAKDLDSLPDESSKMNVLMFGFDSISRNSFQRQLPKSYNYLISELRGHVLNGYNIVGDGTPQALIPILTGFTELELPDTRKRFFNTKFVNSYPFIWNDYKSAGYVTAFFEDLPQSGTFTYRLNGFNATPTDHYMRPYYLSALKETRKWPKLCTGDTPRHKIMFNQIRNFFRVYKNKAKFLFGFHGELSHDDYNQVQVADDDLLELLKDLNNEGYLENTILILMADHGHRFAQIRNTIQGKQEERLPFFSFTFPNAFKTQFKNAYKNFKKNINTLSTPFDIYSTLKSLLDIKNVKDVADISKRSVSLFSEIPIKRSCADAFIEPHWCACLDWEKLDASNAISTRLSNALIDTINDFTLEHRTYCEILKLYKIEWVMKMKPNDNLLKFKKNADLDGFIADLSAKMELKYDTYQIKVILIPGESIFEASITHYLKDDQMVVKMGDISRINMYREQAACVEKDYPQFRKYCYCRH